MVGIGSEVKGHVKREQMGAAAHGGRWTTVWEMERWGGGEGRGVRNDGGRPREKGWKNGLLWVYIHPLQRGLLPSYLQPSPRAPSSSSSCCLCPGLSSTLSSTVWFPAVASPVCSFHFLPLLCLHLSLVSFMCLFPIFLSPPFSFQLFLQPVGCFYMSMMPRIVALLFQFCLLGSQCSASSSEERVWQEGGILSQLKCCRFSLRRLTERWKPSRAWMTMKVFQMNH